MAIQPPEQAPDTPPPSLSYSLREAAEVTGVSRGTVRRYLDEGGRPGRFPNAFQDETGAWRIPIPDLIAAGLSLKARYTGQPEDTPTWEGLTQSGGEVERLRAEVADLRRRLAVSEAIADERARTLDRVYGLIPMLPAKASPWRLFRGRRGDGD